MVSRSCCKVPRFQALHFHQCCLPTVHLAHGNRHCAVRKDQRHCSSWAPCLPVIRGLNWPAFLTTVSHAKLDLLHAKTQSSQKIHLILLRTYKTLLVNIPLALKYYLCTKMFPLFLDVGKIQASPWGGGNTLSAPGLKKVASGMFVTLQLVNQKKMCYRS